MADLWGGRVWAARRMGGRARLAQLEAELAEEIRVLQLIVHLRHFTPSARTPRRQPAVLRIPTQRTAPPGVPSRPRARRRKGHL